MIAPARESAGSSPQRRRILVVDDEAPIARALDRILTRAGFGEIVVETDPNRALRSADARDYDAILLDLHMPGVDGFDLMGRFVEQIGEEAYAPIIVITGDRRFNVRERALESGAKDFLQKPFEPAEVVARLRNIIETARMHRRLTSFNELLTQRVDQQTAGLVAAKLEVVERLAKAGEYRDDMTGKHARRVGTLAGLLARDMGIDEETATTIEQAAPLHDIGKIGVPDQILLKGGGLTDEEFHIMRQHTIIGGAILSGSSFRLLKTAERIALTHHEHWNGQGYPNGLKGDAIPIEGRLTSVADAYDSLTNDRPYREACSPDAAMEEIVRWRQRQFAPTAVDALARLYQRGVLSEIEARTDELWGEREGPTSLLLRGGALTRTAVLGADSSR